MSKHDTQVALVALRLERKDRVLTRQECSPGPRSRTPPLSMSCAFSNSSSSSNSKEGARKGQQHHQPAPRLLDLTLGLARTSTSPRSVDSNEESTTSTWTTMATSAQTAVQAARTLVHVSHDPLPFPTGRFSCTCCARHHPSSACWLGVIHQWTLVCVPVIRLLLRSSLHS